MIIGISGYAKSGKDTVANHICKHYEFEKAAFADVLRQCLFALNPVVSSMEYPALRYKRAIAIFGYEDAKNRFPEIRKLLQLMGTEIGRNILGEDVWVNALFNKLSIHSKNYVISDVRFPNEFDAVKANFGLMVRVDRPEYGPVNDHPSEIALDEHKFDCYLDNNGSIDNFHKQINVYLSALNLNHLSRS